GLRPPRAPNVPKGAHSNGPFFAPREGRVDHDGSRAVFCETSHFLVPLRPRPVRGRGLLREGAVGWEPMRPLVLASLSALTIASPTLTLYACGTGAGGGEGVTFNPDGSTAEGS